MASPLLAATTHLFALEIGSFSFGAVLGWNAYFINRYRKDVVIGDLAAVVSAIGGSAILALFKAKTRSEERRVGKECRFRWSRDQYKNKARRERQKTMRANSQ